MYDLPANASRQLLRIYVARDAAEAIPTLQNFDPELAAKVGEKRGWQT
jgi:hypothetical protein